MRLPISCTQLARQRKRERYIYAHASMVAHIYIYTVMLRTGSCFGKSGFNAGASPWACVYIRCGGRACLRMGAKRTLQLNTTIAVSGYCNNVQHCYIAFRRLLWPHSSAAAVWRWCWGILDLS